MAPSGDGALSPSVIPLLRLCPQPETRREGCHLWRARGAPGPVLSTGGAATDQTEHVPVPIKLLFKDEI